MEWIEDHIRNVAKDVLGVSENMKITFEPIADGLGFLSDSYFVTLTGGSSDHSLFVKVPPKANELRRQFYEEGFPEDAYIFQREFHFYNYVRKLFCIVVEEENKDLIDIVNFIPKALRIPTPII